MREQIERPGWRQKSTLPLLHPEFAWRDFHETPHRAQHFHIEVPLLGFKSSITHVLHLEKLERGNALTQTTP